MRHTALLAIAALWVVATTAATRSPVLAFVGVRVAAMTDDSVLADQTVLVREGRIEAIGPAASLQVPAEAVVIQGDGRYLMPALIDMHVHARRNDLPLYLRAGIAHVRNMWGHSGIPPLVRAVGDGSVSGPTIHSVSRGIDGTPPQWPETLVVLDPKDADAAVAALASEGWAAVKVYQRLGLEAYLAVMDAARRRGMDVVGHVPTAVPVRRALAEGQRSIEHLTGYDMALSRRGRQGTWGWSDADPGAFAGLARATADAGTWNCPTITISVKVAERLPKPQRPAIVTNIRGFVLALSRAGAPLLAGTDAGIDVVAPGTSLHDELSEFVAAGLTPYQALRAATIDAGRFLRIPGLGTVTTGAPADLLLVARSPLEDVAAVRRFDGLVLHGAWSPRPH